MKKIAVIDDDINMRKLIRTAIENYDKNISIITFKDSLELLSILSENYFDLLIIDYMMPAIDGLELIMHYSNIYKKAPIILVTAYPDVDNVGVLNENRDILNLSIVTKPFDMNELVNTVKKMLNNKSASGCEIL